MTSATETRRGGAQAAVFILVGMFTLGLTDNLLALITATSSLWQFHAVRAALVLLMLAAAARLGWGRIWPQRPGAVLARNVFTAGAMLIYFGALAFLPISVVVAGLFTAPIFVLLIAVLFQGEKIGVWRTTAVALGFAGVLLVIQPDPAALDIIAFVPILGGALYAVGAVATRAWCEGEDTIALSFWFFALLLLFGVTGAVILPEGPLGADGFVSRGWMPMDQGTLILFPVLALGAVIGIVCIFKGYQTGQAANVAVFEYSLLIFAAGWAWVLWGETLDASSVLGMILIAGAGSIIALRAPE